MPKEHPMKAPFSTDTVDKKHYAASNMMDRIIQKSTSGRGVTIPSTETQRISCFGAQTSVSTEFGEYAAAGVCLSKLVF